MIYFRKKNVCRSFQTAVSHKQAAKTRKDAGIVEQRRQFDYLTNFGSEINNYSSRSVTGNLTVNFKINTFDLQVFQDCFDQVLNQIHSHNYLVQAELGYLLQHEYDSTLKYFYASNNSKLLDHYYMLDTPGSIERVTVAAAKQIPNFIEKLTQTSNSSSWKFESYVNLKFLLHKLN